MNFIRRLILDRRRKKSGLKFDKDDILKSRPVRNTLIKWEQHPETNLVSLTVPQKKVWWINITSKVFMLPKSRVIVLDEVGSFVWTFCDGYNSIDTIVRALSNKYKLTHKEAETSLLEYFRKLGKRGIIGFAVLKKDQS
jgi:hypothetical protein